MNALKLKERLHTIIDNSETDDIKLWYKIIKDTVAKNDSIKRITESELDIKQNDLHSQDEVQKIIESWKP